MNETAPHSSEPDALQVGADKVLIYDNKIVVLAAHEMDWPVREFSRLPIFFKECKFYVRTKTKAEPPFAMRYELWAWPDNLHDKVPQSVVYDEAYVAERNSHYRSDQFNERGRVALFFLYPFLGFLWSGIKERALVRFGFNARSITSASVTLAFNLFVLEGIFVGWLGTGLLAVMSDSSGLVALDFALLIALAIDSLVRCNQLLQGEADFPYGFLEWLIPRRKKKGL